MKELTTEQIVVGLAHHMTDLVDWYNVKCFAYKYFGSAATTVTVVIGSEYDDETNYDVIESVIVWDAQDNELELNYAFLRQDRTLPPGMLAILDRFEGENDELMPMDVLWLYLLEEVIPNQIPFPWKDKTYDLTVSPEIFFPRLYIRDDDLALLPESVR
jgi:hypothetical protein